LTLIIVNTLCFYIHTKEVVEDNDMILPQLDSSKSYLLKTEGFLCNFQTVLYKKYGCRNTDYVYIYVILCITDPMKCSILYLSVHLLFVF
jgi:hypothetical protein